MNPYWSYLLTAVGVFGLYLAGRKDRRGWMVGIGAQVLWIAYATATHQWGFYVSAVAYGWVYARNAHAWKPRGATEADDLVTLWHIALGERDAARAQAAKVRALCAQWEQVGSQFVSLNAVMADVRAALEGP